MGGYALDALDVSAGPVVAALLADDEAWTTTSAPAVGAGGLNASAGVAAAAAAAVEDLLADTSVVAVEHPPAGLAVFTLSPGVWSPVGEWHDRRMRARWGVAGGLVALAKALEDRIAGGNAGGGHRDARHPGGLLRRIPCTGTVSRDVAGEPHAAGAGGRRGGRAGRCGHVGSGSGRRGGG